MDCRLCSECKNHYKKGGWHCWSGNKSLGLCNWNGDPDPKSKHWNYLYKHGKCVEYGEIKKYQKIMINYKKVADK